MFQVHHSWDLSEMVYLFEIRMRNENVNVNALMQEQGTTVWQPIQGYIDITVGFFAVLPSSYVYNTRTIEREIFPGAVFEKKSIFHQKERWW